MTLKALMSIKSVICLVFGVAFVLFPLQLLGLYDIPVADDVAVMTRLLGAAFIVIGLWLGLARNTEDALSQTATATAVAIGDAVGAVTLVYALLNGVGNLFGWVTVAIYGLLAIGFGWFLLAEPRSQPAV